MTVAGLSLLLDVVLIGLLLAVSVYAIRLQRALAKLRNAKEEMAALLASYAKATQQADSAIARLKAATADEQAALKEGLDEARSLRDDLDFLVKRGNGLADRLEAGVRRGRDIAPEPAPAPVPAIAPDPREPGAIQAPRADDRPDGAPRRGKADLLKALQGLR